MPEILMKNQALEAFLKEVVDAFHAVRPGYMERVRHKIREQASQLVKPSGMTRQGHMKVSYYMPPALYHFAREQAKKRLNMPDLFAGPDRKLHYDLLCKTAMDFKVKTKPTPFIDLGRAACQDKKSAPSASFSSPRTARRRYAPPSTPSGSSSPRR
jgi:hypothetical protein